MRENKNEIAPEQALASTMSKSVKPDYRGIFL